MKNFKALLSFLLAVTLVFVCIPFAGVSAEETTGTDYVIFKTDPSLLGEIGTDVTATGAGSGYVSSEFDVVTATEDAGDYFSYTTTASTSSYNYCYFKSGYSSSELKWLSNKTVLGALGGYIDVSFKVRVTVLSGKKPNYATLRVGTAEEWTTNKSFATRFISKDVTDGKYGSWVEYTATPASWKNFYSGFIGIRYAYESASATTLKVDIKDVTFTINSADKEALNTALSEAGSTYTFDTLISPFTVNSPIFKADPSLFDVGTDVTAQGVESGYIKSHYNVVTVNDDAGDYYRIATDAATSDYGWSYFKSGYSSKTLKWLNDSTVMNVLGGYVDVSYKARVTATSDQKPTYCQMNMGTAHEWTYVNSVDTSFSDAQVVSKYGSWVDYTFTPTAWKNSYSGFIGIKTGFDANPAASLTFDIKDLTFTINSADKDALNAALLEAGSTWTYDTLISAFADLQPGETPEEPEAPEISTEGDNITIWNANPGYIGNKIGTDITLTSLLGDYAKGNAYKKADNKDGTYYYNTSISINNSKGGQGKKIYFASGITSKKKAWLGNETTLSAISSLATISFEYRYTTTDNSGTAGTAFIRPAGEWTSTDVSEFAAVPLSENVKEWTEYSAPIGTLSKVETWYDGWVALDYYFDSAVTGDITFDIRNLKITINSGNETDINNALSTAGSTYTYADLINYTERVGAGYKYETATGTDTILYANPEKITGDSVNAVIPSDSELTSTYTTTKVNDQDGVYYSTEFTVNGNGSDTENTVIDTGIEFTQSGYAWLNNTDILNLIAPYLNVRFQYRFDGTLPTGEPMLYIKAHNEYDTVTTPVANLGNIQLTTVGEWVDAEINAGSISGFTDVWNNADIGFNLYVDGEGNSFEGTQKIDIRDFRIEIDEADRAVVNYILEKMTGIDEIEGFTSGEDIRTDLVGNKDYYAVFTKTAKGIEFDLNDDGIANIVDLVRAKKLIVSSGVKHINAIVLKRGDYDSDGALAASDLVGMRRNLLGKLPFASVDSQDILRAIPLYNHTGDYIDTYDMGADGWYYNTVSIEETEENISTNLNGEPLVDELGGGKMLVYENADSESYVNYINDLESVGYEFYDDNDLNGNLFSTYISDENVVTVSYLPNVNNQLNILVEPMRELATLEEDNIYEDKNIPSSVTLVTTAFIGKSNGACIIYQLCDGSFIIIDSGHGYTHKVSYPDTYEDQAKVIYNTLMNLLPEGQEKPVIAAWFISHAHNDHIGGMIPFADLYADSVEVERFIVNFPDHDSLQDVWRKNSDLNYIRIRELQEAFAKFQGAVLVEAHAGQTFHIRNAEIDILSTWELMTESYADMTSITYGNESSLVFDVKIDGERMMILNDVNYKSVELLEKMYDADFLKSDFVQVAHHGYDDVSSLYEKINADIVLWCEKTAGYLTSHNAVLADLEIYAAGTGITYIPLPYAGDGTKTTWDGTTSVHTATTPLYWDAENLLYGNIASVE